MKPMKLKRFLLSAFFLAILPRAQATNCESSNLGREIYDEDVNMVYCEKEMNSIELKKGLNVRQYKFPPNTTRTEVNANFYIYKNKLEPIIYNGEGYDFIKGKGLSSIVIASGKIQGFSFFKNEKILDYMIPSSLGLKYEPSLGVLSFNPISGHTRHSYENIMAGEIMFSTSYSFKIYLKTGEFHGQIGKDYKTDQMERKWAKNTFVILKSGKLEKAPPRYMLKDSECKNSNSEPGLNIAEPSPCSLFSIEEQFSPRNFPFKDLNLEKSKFYGLNLEGVVFDNVNLKKTSFDKNNLKGATFKNSNLQNAVMTISDYSDMKFLGSDLRGMKLILRMNGVKSMSAGLNLKGSKFNNDTFILGLKGNSLVALGAINENESAATDNELKNSESRSFEDFEELKNHISSESKLTSNIKTAAGVLKKEGSFYFEDGIPTYLSHTNSVFGKYEFDGRYKIGFHENGLVMGGILSRDYLIGDVELKKGDVIRLDRYGLLSYLFNENYTSKVRYDLFNLSDIKESLKIRAKKVDSDNLNDIDILSHFNGVYWNQVILSKEKVIQGIKWPAKSILIRKSYYGNKYIIVSAIAPSPVELEGIKIGVPNSIFQFCMGNQGNPILEKYFASNEDYFYKNYLTPNAELSKIRECASYPKFIEGTEKLGHKIQSEYLELNPVLSTEPLPATIRNRRQRIKILSFLDFSYPIHMNANEVIAWSGVDYSSHKDDVKYTYDDKSYFAFLPQRNELAINVQKAMEMGLNTTNAVGIDINDEQGRKKTVRFLLVDSSLFVKGTWRNSYVELKNPKNGFGVIFKSSGGTILSIPSCPSGDMSIRMLLANDEVTDKYSLKIYKDGTNELSWETGDGNNISRDFDDMVNKYGIEFKQAISITVPLDTNFQILKPHSFDGYLAVLISKNRPSMRFFPTIDETRYLFENIPKGDYVLRLKKIHQRYSGKFKVEPNKINHLSL